MKCRFKKGDAVVINNTAEETFEYIGQKATVIEIIPYGKGDASKGIEVPNTCWLTIRLVNGKEIKHVLESELSALPK